MRRAIPPGGNDDRMDVSVLVIISLRTFSVLFSCSSSVGFPHGRDPRRTSEQLLGVSVERPAGGEADTQRGRQVVACRREGAPMW